VLLLLLLLSVLLLSCAVQKTRWQGRQRKQCVVGHLYARRLACTSASGGKLGVFISVHLYTML
jgi:hypothetical protein